MICAKENMSDDTKTTAKRKNTHTQTNAHANGRMIPTQVPTATLQALYLKNNPEMEIRLGPITTNRKRALTAVGVEKLDFGARSTLLAPPILFQTRQQPSIECGFTYSGRYIKDQYEKAMNDKCAYPMLCMSLKPESMISCSSSTQHINTSHFGLNPMLYQAEYGYADFLYSIADHENLYRNNEFSSTSNFIDSLTQTIQLVFVFFSPGAGLVTMLNVHCDMSSIDDAKTKIYVDHFGVLEGYKLNMYMFIQTLVLLNIVVMIFDIFSTFKTVTMALRRGEDVQWKMLIEPLFDTVTAILIIVYTALRMSSVLMSASQATNILGNLDQIPYSFLIILTYELFVHIFPYAH